MKGHGLWNWLPSSGSVVPRWHALPGLHAFEAARLPAGCGSRVAEVGTGPAVISTHGPYQNSRGNHTRPTQLVVGFQSLRNLQWDEEVAGEDIVVEMTEWRRRMKLAARNPSVGLGPLPVGC